VPSTGIDFWLFRQRIFKKEPRALGPRRIPSGIRAILDWMGTHFLDDLERKLKLNHSPEGWKVIKSIGSRVRDDYINSRYTSRAEAEKAFANLVEQSEACKATKVVARPAPVRMWREP
jgi:hypothetical protein